MNKILKPLVLLVIITVLSIVSAFVLNVSVEIKLVLIFIGISGLLLLGIANFIFQLEKVAQNNRNEYREYAKTITGGVIVGLIVSVLTELKPTNPFSIEGAFESMIILFLMFFMLATFAPVFVFVYKKPQKRKSKNSSR